MTPEITAKFENKLKDRFLSLLRKSDACWTLDKVPDQTGYLSMKFKGKSIRAHRVSYWVFKGEWPPENLLICHVCDNRRCVNPDHMFLGTHKDNVADAMSKGRHRPPPSRGKTVTHCPYGHLYDELNTIVYTSKSGEKSRKCKACRDRNGLAFRKRRANELMALKAENARLTEMLRDCVATLAEEAPAVRMVEVEKYLAGKDEDE